MREKAVILAAGEGQRLRPFTRFKPKVMIPIANKPILQYTIEALKRNGIMDIVVVVGYRKEQVLDYFGSGERFGVNIDYVVQSQQLGTAHALKQAKGKTGDNFIVVAGDVIGENISEADTIAALTQGEDSCLLVKEQKDSDKRGTILIEDGVVKEILEEPKQAATNIINTGLYRLTRDVFDFIEQETDLPTVLNKMIQHGHIIRAHTTEGVLLDVVYPWDILKLNDIALSRISPTIGGTVDKEVVFKGLVSIGEGSIVRSNTCIIGPVVIGENCDIGPGVYIFPGTSIGDHVCISPLTEIRNSVIGDNVEIGSNSSIHDSIIDRGCVLTGHLIARSGKAELKVDEQYHEVVMGAMIGENCSIEECTIIRPGAMVGNNSKIAAFKIIREHIPDESLVI